MHGRDEGFAPISISTTMRKMGALVVGISGPSGSGKTSVVEAAAIYFARARIVSLDAFYHVADDAPDGSWEDPACIDFEALVLEVERCKDLYSLVLVEGFVLLASPRIQSLLDLVIVLDCTQATARARRLERDIACEDDPANSAEYYNKFVWPAHERYMSSSVGNAHVDLLVNVASKTLQEVVHCVREFISTKMASGGATRQLAATSPPNELA